MDRRTAIKIIGLTGLGYFGLEKSISLINSNFPNSDVKKYDAWVNYYR